MKVILLFTGKTEDTYLKEGIEVYLKRLRRYIPTEIKIISEPRKKTKVYSGKVKIRESEKIKSLSGNTSFLVLLDQRGKHLNSEDFAGFIENVMNRGYKEIIFATGGAYGFSDDFSSNADSIISMSEMTFTHQMVRLILAEQLYRAMTIIKGEPYHH
jgi:23S rRNA (pseudouridine1915-N3)-methyltransferase